MDQKHQGSKAFTGNVSDIDLRLLRVFREVVKCRGFTGAEIALGAGKSTISKHIADLEDRIGVCLCRRGRSGFALTAEGEKIYEATLQLFSSLDAFKANVNAAHARVEGRLSVGVADTILADDRSPLMTTLAIFRRKTPDVHLHLAVATTTEVERGMLDGTFDIGVVGSRNPHRSFLCYGLHQERSLLYCANGHPLFADGMRRAAVAVAAFAMRGHSEDEQAFVEQGVLARAATAGNSDAVAALILTGEYIGFLPERYAAPFEQRGAIRALLPHLMTYRTNLTAVTRKGVPVPPAAELFLTELLKASRPASTAAGLLHQGSNAGPAATRQPSPALAA